MSLRLVEAFDHLDNVSAYFTEANRDLINADGTIPGLNLGYNTSAATKEIEQNFKALFNELEWDHQNLAIAEQVHGTHIEIVDKPGTYKNCDGLITKKAGLAIAIRVADCAAILVADPLNNVIGAFHAGWRGAAGNIIKKGVKLMTEQGAEVKNMRTFCSPCIMEKNFEVGTEVAELFPKQFVNSKDYTKPHVNLQAFIRHQLIGAGVTESNIDVVEMCTMDHDQFYSYRREREGAGRMLAMLKLNS